MPRILRRSIRETEEVFDGDSEETAPCEQEDGSCPEPTPKQPRRANQKSDDESDKG